MSGYKSVNQRNIFGIPCNAVEEESRRILLRDDDDDDEAVGRMGVTGRWYSFWAPAGGGLTVSTAVLRERGQEGAGVAT